MDFVITLGIMGVFGVGVLFWNLSKSRNRCLVVFGDIDAKARLHQHLPHYSLIGEYLQAILATVLGTVFAAIAFRFTWNWNLAIMIFVLSVLTYPGMVIAARYFVRLLLMAIVSLLRHMGKYSLQCLVSKLQREFGAITYCSKHFNRITSIASIRLRPVSRFDGRLVFPKRIYEGDSQNVEMAFQRNFSVAEMSHKLYHVKMTEGSRSMTLSTPEHAECEYFVEIDLVAAGIVIDGEKKQRQSLESSRLDYTWSCHFPNSGNHTVMFQISVISPSSTIELGAVEYKIRVVRIDSLTKRQVWIVAVILGIISGGAALAGALHQLGLL